MRCSFQTLFIMLFKLVNVESFVYLNLYLRIYETLLYSLFIFIWRDNLHIFWHVYILFPLNICNYSLVNIVIESFLKLLSFHTFHQVRHFKLLWRMTLQTFFLLFFFFKDIKLLLFVIKTRLNGWFLSKF